MVLTILTSLVFPFTAFASSGLADSPWPVFHGDSKLTGQSKYETGKVDGTIKWRFKTEGGMEASPIIGKDGTIYIADQKCNLYAINTDGTQKWKFNGGEPVYSKEWKNSNCTQSTPAIVKDGTIYFITMAGYFYAINPDGTEKWRFPMFTFKNIWSSPAIASDGTIYFASEAYPPRESGKPQEKPGYIYALNPDGTKKWEFTTGAAGGSTSVAAIADDGTLYLSSAEMEESKGTFVNKLFAFNPDGTVKWKYWPQNRTMEGSVSIGTDGIIYFGVKGTEDPREAEFIALNPDGTEKWKVALDQGESITPAIDKNGNIYFGDWGGKFYAFDKNGKELWQVQTPKAYETLSSSPAIGAEGTLYFGSTTGQFFAYTPEGKEKWQIRIEGGGIIASPAIGSDSTVYVTSVPGELLAIGEKDDAQVSTSASFTNNKSILTNKNIIYLSIIAALLAILIIALLMVQKKLVNNGYNSKKINIIIAILIVVEIALLALLIFSLPIEHSATPSLSENEKCPKNIYQQGANTYYIPGENNTKQTLSSEEINWIKSNCQETVWPEQQKQDPSNNQEAERSANCPHHIYGKEENGFYGAFKDMKTKDLTAEDISWIKVNCPDTTWPEQMR